MKKIFTILLIVSVFISISSVYAQEFSFAEPAKQLLVSVTIDDVGHVKVEHKIDTHDNPREVSLISGNMTNITVVNDSGKKVQFATSGDEKKVVLFPSDEITFVKYDLDGVISDNDGIWKWDFLYTGNDSTVFFFPKSVDLVFANDRPVYIGEQKGMKCHGCQMKLEYVIDEPEYVGHVTWENEEFDVIVRTLGELKSINFDQPNKTISLDIDGNEKFVTAVIPLKLLWNPYDVTVNDTKILRHEFNNNGTHIWLNVRPDTSGVININGTTAIPEFPIFAPLVIGILFVVIIQYKNRISLR